jgi:hypothetical protein
MANAFRSFNKFSYPKKAVKLGFAQRSADQNPAPEVVAVVKEFLAPRRHRVSKMVSANDALRISGDITCADKDFNLVQPHSFAA